MQESFCFSYKRAFFKLQKLCSLLSLPRSLFHKSLYLLGLMHNAPFSAEQFGSVLYVVGINSGFRIEDSFFEAAFSQNLFFIDSGWYVRVKQVQKKYNKKRRVLNNFVSAAERLRQRGAEHNKAPREILAWLELLDIVTVFTHNKLPVWKTIHFVMYSSPKRRLERLRAWHSMNPLGWVDSAPVPLQLEQQTYIPFFERVVLRT